MPESLNAALAWLTEDAPGPFLCWIHLYDPHAPYRAHPELAGTPLAGVASYDADVAFADRQVGRLVEALRARDTHATGRPLPPAPAGDATTSSAPPGFLARSPQLKGALWGGGVVLLLMKSPRGPSAPTGVSAAPPPRPPRPCCALRGARASASAATPVSTTAEIVRAIRIQHSFGIELI